LRFTNARIAFCHPGFLTLPKGRNRNWGRTIGARIGDYCPILLYREEPKLVSFCPVEVFRDRKDKRDDPPVATGSILAGGREDKTEVLVQQRGQARPGCG